MKNIYVQTHNLNLCFRFLLSAYSFFSLLDISNNPFTLPIHYYIHHVEIPVSSIDIIRCCATSHRGNFGKSLFATTKYRCQFIQPFIQFFDCTPQ